MSQKLNVQKAECPIKLKVRKAERPVAECPKAECPRAECLSVGNIDLNKEYKSLPEVAESIVQIEELLRSPEVVNGGDKGEMDDDLVVEAEGKLTIGGVTHCFLFALGFDDPEHNQ